MTAPCAIEYILVTRWRGGRKGGQNRVCACDTRDRGVNKKLKPEHPSETVVMPESGERKRNLTTLVLVKNAAVKRSRSRQKVSESSQNPLSLIRYIPSLVCHRRFFLLYAAWVRSRAFFFWLVAAWVKSRAERPSVSVVNRQLHVQIGCKLGIRNRKDELEASKAKQITN